MVVSEDMHPAFPLAHSPGNIHAHKHNAYHGESSFNRQVNQKHQVQHFFVTGGVLLLYRSKHFPDQASFTGITGREGSKQCCFLQRAALHV